VTKAMVRSCRITAALSTPHPQGTVEAQRSEQQRQPQGLGRSRAAPNPDRRLRGLRAGRAAPRLSRLDLGPGG
jgi:hypothetical protein